MFLTWVLLASVCCLPNCIICKCVLPAQLYYLQVCAACPTVLFASVCCPPNCIICKCVLPAQLYYLQVCAACPTVLFASVCCLPNCIICKRVLPAQLYYLEVCAACPTVLFANVCCLPNSPSYSKRFEPRPSLGTTSMIVPYRHLARYNVLQSQLIHFLHSAT
jgi:hypothetical protein